ncbi:hypothetical protein MUN78_07060 [Leucobacter allii]|uniref:DUF7352 domain-containing protein n=1 Tax=Leucobacter allii TaxID=2932247 RepID=A0ABY4FQM2_9MICO|nr:hypothetical protein [Leucobacter allii]UOQ58576.1 hypothetical protein MUN78_07060 [Leucobacter allii]
MMSKIIHRYRVMVGVVDHQVHPAGRVVHVSADRGGKDDVVEVWVEHEADAGKVLPSPGGIFLNVYGTGIPIPDNAGDHVGSCCSGPFVWHVYARREDR